jgi:transposase
MRMETFIRRSLGLKAHAVVKVEEREAEGERELLIYVERLGQRRLRCGVCGLQAQRVAPTRRPERRWRDLAIRTHTVWLVYAPYRVWCARCGLRVERIPWAELWQRVTQELAREVATLARDLPWLRIAVHVGLNWKTVEAIVEGAVLWGLAHRRWHPLHVIGIDEVSRRKGHQYLTIVYDLERGRVVWVGRDRSAATMQQFFAWLGPRRAPSIRTVCCDMWAVYLDALHAHLPHATVLFDRFHLTQHLSRAVDDVRRQTWRQMQGRTKAEFKQTRFLWLKNPENLRRDERTRLSALLRLNSPIVRGYLLKEDLRRFWDYRQTHWAEAHLRQWLWRASHSRLAPFQKLARMLRAHLPGILAWTRIRVTNGALEGMNNKIKQISHRAFGYRTTWAYIANIYHCCAALPLP